MKRVLALALLSTAGLWAAERVSAYRAQFTGPGGAVANGMLVTVGDQVVFVDSDQPELSFAVPRSDVQSLSLGANGTVSAQVAQPFMGPFGQSSLLTVRLTDPASADTVVHWIGVPLTSGEPRTDTAEMGARSQSQPVMFNVKRGDDNGRLIVGPDGIDFEDISNRSKSQHWSYSELKGVDRNAAKNQIIVRPYQGDEYKFTTSTAMDDVIYNTIADRIVAARPHR